MGRWHADGQGLLAGVPERLLGPDLFGFRQWARQRVSRELLPAVIELTLSYRRQMQNGAGFNLVGIVIQEILLSRSFSKIVPTLNLCAFLPHCLRSLFTVWLFLPTTPIFLTSYPSSTSSRRHSRQARPARFVPALAKSDRGEQAVSVKIEPDSRMC
jgi:hypothetical protein